MINKTSLKQYLLNNLKGISLEDKEKLLLKIQKEWIPSILDGLKKKHTYCNYCKKYSYTSKFKKIQEIETCTEITYWDCGYGDDDRYGEVEYLVEYLKCPLCGKEKEVNRKYMRLIREY